MNGSRPSVLTLTTLFVCLLAFLACGAAQVNFAPGRYVGKVEIRNLNACEEFGWASPSYSTNGKGSVKAFLNVSQDSAVLTLDLESLGNTQAMNWFETKARTLTLAPGHMIGGIRHHSGYYFNVKFRHIAATGKYVGTGTWIIQDACEAKVHGYPVTITLERKDLQADKDLKKGPPFQPCFVNSGSVASAGPCKRAPNDPLSVRMSRTLPNPPATLLFKAALAHGVPASVTSPLSGSGKDYSTPVPAALCAAGTGGKWEIFLLDSTGKLWGNIGRLSVHCNAAHK